MVADFVFCFKIILIYCVHCVACLCFGIVIYDLCWSFGCVVWLMFVCVSFGWFCGIALNFDVGFCFGYMWVVWDVFCVDFVFDWFAVLVYLRLLLVLLNVKLLVVLIVYCLDFGLFVVFSVGLYWYVGVFLCWVDMFIW